ncbi:GTP-binding protein yptV1 [Pelomyxa schiedti]|nr:GTP-binding protein yptV1 [Pelomyxa schiedti]
MSGTPPVNEPILESYKLLMIGDPNVGKSSIILRFTENRYDPNYACTIGVDYKLKTVQLETHTIRLQIWDTAGSERFRTIVSSYYRGAHGIAIVYDVTNKPSFINIKHWLGEIDRYACDNAVKILIGNKCEMGRREVSTEEGQKLADSLGVSFFEVSSKEGINVDLAFSHLCHQIYTFLTNSTLSKAPSLHLVAEADDDFPPPKKRTCC